MNKKICKYELNKILKPMIIFYCIYFFIIISIKILSCFFEGFDGITRGTDLSTIVFVLLFFIGEMSSLIVELCLLKSLFSPYPTIATE